MFVIVLDCYREIGIITICIAVAGNKLDALKGYASQQKIPLSVVGEFVEGKQCEIRDFRGRLFKDSKGNGKSGYTHF